MKKIRKPCGLHCIKINHLGVRLGEQVILVCEVTGGSDGGDMSYTVIDYIEY